MKTTLPGDRCNGERKKCPGRVNSAASLLVRLPLSVRKVVSGKLLLHRD